MIFLGLHLNSQKSTQLASILKNNELRISTINSADTYFLDKNSPSGFEYDLATAFAEHLNVQLKLTVRIDPAQLTEDLMSRDSHISIPGRSEIIPNTASILATTSYTSNQSVAIYRETRGIKYPRGLINIAGRRVLLTTGSPQELQMTRQRFLYPTLSWESIKHITTYEILERVFNKEADIAIISLLDFQAVGPFFPGLKIGFKFQNPQKIHWLIVDKKDRSLQRAVNTFLSLESTETLIKTLNKKYYQSSNPLNYFDTVTFKKDFNTRLPALEQHFRAAAKKYDFDWLLLVAIAYQESHWNPKAVSPTGVKGIMMLTKAAAREVKVTDRTDPIQSIFGGAEYLRNVKEKIPSRIKEPDRTFLALAGYNTGFGHLEDARILATRAGLNPDSWAVVNKQLPLLTKAKYYTTVKHGYARGYEPVNYVKNIRQYLKILTWEKEQKLLQQSIDIQQQKLSEKKHPNISGANPRTARERNSFYLIIHLDKAHLSTVTI